MSEEKALSHSEGKPKLGNIFRWLDEDFLLAMAEQGRISVEDMKKYPKNNWQTGAPDEEFIEARFESALRHLREEIKNPGSVDHETGQSNLVCVAYNCMMAHYHQSRVKKVMTGEIFGASGLDLDDIDIDPADRILSKKKNKYMEKSVSEIKKGDIVCGYGKALSDAKQHTGNEHYIVVSFPTNTYCVLPKTMIVEVVGV